MGHCSSWCTASMQGMAKGANELEQHPPPRSDGVTEGRAGVEVVNLKQHTLTHEKGGAGGCSSATVVTVDRPKGCRERRW